MELIKYALEGMITIFPLGIRAWLNGSMVYTNKFDVNALRETRAGTVGFCKDNKHFETDAYMLITHSSAVNGDVYEYDVLKGPDNYMYVVVFDSSEGRFVGKQIDGDGSVPIKTDMFEYEIIGNPLETPELFEKTRIISFYPEITKYLIDAESSMDITKDLLDEVDESEIDYGEGATAESIREAQKDIEEEMKKNIDVSLTLDEGAIIVPSLAGDITDEYVDLVYSLIDSERIKNCIPMYIIDEEIVIIYVESSYEPNNKIGSYAFRIEWDGYEISDAGQSKNISGPQGSELNAVVKALCTIRTPSKIRIYSSSKYVIAPFEKGWIYQWEKNGWRKNGEKEKIKNSGLFSKLLKLTKVHAVEFDYVKDLNSNMTLASCKDKARAMLRASA